MNGLDVIKDLPKETLIDIIEMLGKNWLTVDGLWFQIVEREYGLETATRFDEEMWSKQLPTEVRRIKKALKIDEKGPLAVARANLFLTAYFGPGFDFDIKEISPSRVVQTCVRCPNQEARMRQGQEGFSCKRLGMAERTNFAKFIDPEVQIKCLVCPPDPHPDEFWCQWEFTK